MEARPVLTVEEYHERARQCLRMGREMGDLPGKVLLLHMAQFWIGRAEALGRRDN